MKYRKLGATGLEVSEIGFGGWGIGGVVKDALAYGKTDDRRSLDALTRAFELGVTFFDTSDFYGYGHSEALIGQALAAVRDKVVISTKTGLVNAQGQQDFSKPYIRQCLEASLKRLKSERVDLYLMHNPSLETLREQDVISTLRELQAEGKIRAFGISLRALEDGPAVISEFGVGCIEVNFNLSDQRLLESGLLELCIEKKVGVIARTPLCFGFLTGQYKRTDELDAGDHRKNHSADQVARWNQAAALFSSALKINQTQTAAQAALRFCLSYPISSAIPGMLSREQVEENILASEQGPLSSDLLKSVSRIYAENVFFSSKKGGQ